MLTEIRRLIDDNTLFLFNTRTQDPNFVYLSDVSPGYESNALLITKTRFTHLTSVMEYERAKKESLATPKIVKGLFKYLEKNHRGKLLVNGKFLPLTAYKKIKKFARVQDFSEELEKIRLIKTKEEISRIRKAKKNALASFKKADLTKTEEDIRRQLEFNYEPAYPAIVAADGNSSLPHYFSATSKAKKLLLIDFGASYKNRICDITITKLLNPTKKMKKVYEIAQQAQNTAIDTAAPGIKASEVTKTAYNIIKKAGYGKNILHALGHGIGVQIHEGPVISEKSETILEPGMVFTIEPGIYTKTFGVRLEDDFVITKNGCKVI